MTESTVTSIPQRASVGRELATGWRTLVVSTIGFACSISSLVFYSIGLFVPELMKEFGWSAGGFSLLSLAATLIVVVMSPLVGLTVDRFGARVPAAFSLVAVAAGFYAMSFVGPNFAIYAAIWMAMFLLASFGTAPPFTQAVCISFDRLRGTALGIVLAGGGVTAVVVPRVLGTTIAQNWRSGFLILAEIALAAAVVVYVGLAGQASGRPVKLMGAAPRASFADIAPFLTKPLLIRLAAPLTLVALAMGGLPLWLVSMLVGAGSTLGQAADAASYIGVALIIGRFCAGLLIDRFFAPRVGSFLVLLAAVLVALYVIDGRTLGITLALAAGLTLGFEYDLMGYLIARYYGMRVFSRMSGIFMTVTTGAIGLSPVWITWIRELTGGYNAPMLISVALLVVAAALFLTLPRFPGVPLGDALEAAAQRKDEKSVTN